MAEQPEVKRPEHAVLSMWSDLQLALGIVSDLEFLVGLAPEKPRAFDLEQIEVKLTDLRGVLGTLALALTEQQR